MSEAELRPCPFCGGPGSDGYGVDYGDGTRSEALQCGDCDASGPPGPSYEAGVTLWNTRPAEDAVVERIAAWMTEFAAYSYSADDVGMVKAIADDVRQGVWKGGK